MSSDNSSLVSVASPSTEVEALRLKAVLDDGGVPCIIRSNLDTAYDGLYVAQKGFGQILVASDLADEARALIAESE